MLEIQKKLTNTFYSILSLPATAMGFTLSIQIAALSWLLKTQYNLDIHEVGIVWAAGPIAGIIGQPIVGLISDNVWFWGGRRRPFIVMGATVAALTLFALPNIHVIDDFLGIGSLMLVAIGVALSLDLAINISFNPTRSIIADVTPEGIPRTKGYTWMQTISGSFGVMAYAIGAIFGNYFLIYFGVGLVFLFSIIPVFIIKEPRELVHEGAEDAKKQNDSGDSFIATKWDQLLKIYLANGFSWLGIQTMFVFMFFFSQQKVFGNSDFEAELPEALSYQIGQTISISFLILNAVGAALPALVLEPITEKIGRIKTHSAAVGIMALGYLSIVMFVDSAPMLYVSMAVCGIGWAAVVSLPFAIMSEKVDKRRMGFFMGIFNLSIVIPQLIVSLVIGYVVEAFADKNIIFMISTVSLALSSIFWSIVKEEKYVTGADEESNQN